MPTDQTPHTRLLFLGDASLGEGFGLIGFEVYADPTLTQLEQLLGELVDAQHSAFVMIDRRIAEQHCPLLDRIRAEGGRILISGVPPLNDPECFHCALDDSINKLLGGQLEAESH